MIQHVGYCNLRFSLVAGLLVAGSCVTSFPSLLWVEDSAAPGRDYVVGVCLGADGEGLGLGRWSGAT